MKEQHKYLCLSVIILLSSFIFLGVLELKPSWAQSVIKTIPVGDFPVALEYNPINKYVYVSNSDSDDVSVINSANNTVIKTIPVGDGPGNLVYFNNKVYVVNSGSDTVSVIDGVPIR